MMDNPCDLPLLEFASKAARDLRKLMKQNRGGAKSIRDGLDELRRGATNLDAKPVQGHPPWWRLRIGDWRVLYRELSAEEVAELCRARLPKGSKVPEDATGWLVFRIVNRKDLDRAVGPLP